MVYATSLYFYNHHRKFHAPTSSPFYILFYVHGFIMIKGKPCKILSIYVTRPGKSGHTKHQFLAVDVFTGKKLEDVIYSGFETTVPIVVRDDWEIIDIEGDKLTLRDEYGNFLPSSSSWPKTSLRPGQKAKTPYQLPSRLQSASNRSSRGRWLTTKFESVDTNETDFITGSIISILTTISLCVQNDV